MSPIPAQAPAEDLVFDHSLEGIFKGALGKRMTPRCLERMKAEGMDFSQKLKPTYPRELVYRCLDIARQELYPGVERERALREIGYGFLEGYDQTFLGKAVIGMIRLLGPRRTLIRASQNMKASNNYQQTEFRELGPNQAELTMSQVSSCASYFAGLIQRAVEVAGGKEVKVEALPGGEPGCTYRVQWS